MAKQTSRRQKTSPSRSRQRHFSSGKTIASLLGFFLFGLIGLLLFAGAIYIVHLDGVIRSQFEGKRWALPARVYARPLELFEGMTVGAEQFAKELRLLHYRSSEQLERPGTYSRQGDTFQVVSRGFDFWDGPEPTWRAQLRFRDNALVQLTNLNDGGKPGLLRMEPLEIAGIYPSHNQDRILVKREQIPPILVDTLIAVEDRTFYEHWGVDPKGILRALIANIQAGRTVQGGSTLTQQLVKNYFLSNERTLTRKVNEALMAVLLEWHYSKDEILEAYANEVYLGQDGNRAIHGFGLASRFYFGRPLAELDLHQVALLVGIVRGPSYYDPRRRPERSRERRSLVLDVMVDQGLISAEDAAIAKQKPLDVLPKSPSGVTRYPAFLDLVQRQLREYYREEDLTSEGLKIFTTLDPQAQLAAEQAIIQGLPILEKRHGLKADMLQGAAIVAGSQNGEVQAIVGGRDVRLAGFNRALDAKRLIGSLIKPAVYLTALEYPNIYTLASLLNDTPFTYTTSDGKNWSPENYSKRYHGEVMLIDALAHSYNIPTARLGLDLDVIRVTNTLQRLGVNQDLKPFPSLLLGAIDLTPLEVAQMYETFASGGFRIPLRAIREVTTAEGEPLQRYPLKVEKAVEPGPNYLVTRAMQSVVQSGTARAMSEKIPANLGIAGKTGTTDDLRDSWFAGFSGNLLSVVWLGRDNNTSAGLSGSSGALRIWMDTMRALNLEPLNPTAPPGIELVLVDPQTGLRADTNCPSAKMLPFLNGSAPQQPAPCSADFFYSRYSDPYYNTDRPGTRFGPSGNRNRPESDPIRSLFKRLME